MYVGNETRVLGNIEAFCMCWNSSINGLIADLVKDCLTVVQGCRMMEVLTIDTDNHIKSLLQNKPDGARANGTIVVFTSITIKEHALTAMATKVEGPRRFLGAGMFRRGAVSGPSSSAATTTTAGSKASSGPAETGTSDPTQAELDTTHREDIDSEMPIDTTPPLQLLVGIRYEGIEHMRTATYDTATRSYIVPELHVTIRSERTVVVSMYEIDDQLNILAEYIGKMHFQSFQETELKASLSAPVPIGSTATNPTKFDAVVEVHWPNKYEFIGETKDLSHIKGFKVNIKRARDLLAAKSNNTTDPFCEILYGNKVIKQTEVKKKTLTPIWEENVTVPYTGQQHSLIVDVYDMNFMRKGEFLGRVEIPHEHLVNSNNQEVEYGLKTKHGVNIKKQMKVNGSITLQCNIIETIEVQQLREEEISQKARSTAEIPKYICDMYCPLIELTIKSATDLAQANRFGGSSDPFVLVFMGDDSDPIEKTHFIANTLNPKWNSVFNIQLGISMEKGVTNIQHFPTFRLEVYDYNKVKTMDFLGSCEIPPSVYLVRNEIDFILKPLQNKKNDLVKGKIQAEFKIIDKIFKKKEHIYSFTLLKTLQSYVSVEVHILRARGLMQANQVGNSDPYVVVKWNNIIYGQTSVKINTLNPVWKAEKFIVPIYTHGGFNVEVMVFEVWDKDYFKEGEFMGEARVTGDVFMHPASGAVDLTLLPRSYSSNHQNNDTTGNTTTTATASKIRGTLSVRFVSYILPQHPPCEQQSSREYKLSQPTLDPMNVLMTYDPQEEIKRQKRENMEFSSIIEKTTKQMDKYINNPFERTGLISELHYGQLISASKRGDKTILKTQLTDMICVPSYHKNPSNQTGFYLMARYESGKISYRDIEFFDKIHKKLMSGLCHINEREKRLQNFIELEKGLEVMSKATDNPAGVIVQVLLDLEITLNCKVNLYLLGNDGITLTMCSADIGEVDIETPPADEFIMYAAQICRYGFIIQKYHGEYSIINTLWESFNQLTTCPLSSMSPTFDELEQPHIIRNFMNLGDIQAVDGVVFAPLRASNEVFMGMLMLTKVDAVPSANYRQLPLVEDLPPTTTTSTATATVAAVEGVNMKNTNESSNQQQQLFTVVEKMEHGFMNTVSTASALFANAICSSRLGTVYRKIKSFPIKFDTNPVMIIRYAFRLLVTAIPAISNISVWAVNLNKDPILLYSTAIEQIAPAGLYSMLVSMSTRVSQRLTAGLSSRKNLSATEPTVTPAELEQLQETVPQIPSVVAGMFGSEHPRFLLAAPIERVGIGGNNNENKTTVTRQSAVSGHQQIINDLKTKTTEKFACWKVNIPLQLQKTTFTAGNTAFDTILENEGEDDDSLSLSVSNRGEGEEVGGEKEELHAFDDKAMNLVHAEISR